MRRRHKAKLNWITVHRYDRNSGGCILGRNAVRPGFSIECDNGWPMQRPNVASMTRASNIRFGDPERLARVELRPCQIQLPSATSKR